ncbi:MAG: cell division protein ZapE, partial [Allopontixanthobacter sediminis]
MSDTISRYDELVAAGELRPDPEQREAARKLARLREELVAQSRQGFFSKLLGKREPPRGVYLWGGVGRGKSMLMDLFHEALAIEEKRRVHFHAFMLEVHVRLHKERQNETGDPIIPVAARIAEGIRCLAFDEMVVNNSADAMIMSRLFRALIVDHGITIVTTSNRPPQDLYKDGLNREHFLPFIALIEQRLNVVPLNGPTDYRLERLGGIDSWYTPADDAATAQLREVFFRLTDYNPDDAENVPSGALDLG